MPSNFGIEIELCGFTPANGYWDPYMGGPNSPWEKAAAMLNGLPDGTGSNFNVFCEGSNTYQTSESWKTVREYSIDNGLELVSPILPCDDEGYTRIRSMMTHLRTNHAFMSNSCGQHIHLDARFLRGWSDYHLEAFFKFLIEQYAKHEATFDSFVKNNRRGRSNYYCKTMAAKSLENIYWDREHKLNLCSFFKYGSIEFRQFQGTLNAEATIAWIKLCSTFLENCRQAYMTANPDITTEPELYSGPLYSISRYGYQRRAA